MLVCRFRRLAMKHHPDIDAEGSSKEEFTRICEAYDVLSNGRCCQKDSAADQHAVLAAGVHQQHVWLCNKFCLPGLRY